MAIRQSKKECWQKFITEIEGVNEMTSLGKIIIHHPRYEVGLMKDSKGKYTTSPEDLSGGLFFLPPEKEVCLKSAVFFVLPEKGVQ